MVLAPESQYENMLESKHEQEDACFGLAKGNNWIP